MLLNKSSEDLETKTLRSFSFNKSFFQKTYQSAFLEKVWLHSYGRNASNVATSEIGLLKEAANLTKEEAEFQETYFRSILGLLIIISILCIEITYK